MPYNRIRIRELILESFSDEEFMTFCQDHFGEAVNQFGSATSQEAKARELVGWCERREKIQELVEKIKLRARRNTRNTRRNWRAKKLRHLHS
jgi:hypothetical protein